MSKESPLDRRVQRTRDTLRNALITLMAEHGWDEINIRDLCIRANVGRSTFYHHFQNKEELLVASFADLQTLLCAQADLAATSGYSMPFVRGLIEHVQEQRQLFRSVIGRRSGHVVQKRFRETVLRLVRDSGAVKGHGWQREASISYVAGALVEMLTWWVDNGTSQTPAEMEAHFYALTQLILQP